MKWKHSQITLQVSLQITSNVGEHDILDEAYGRGRPFDVTQNQLGLGDFQHRFFEMFVSSRLC